MLAGDKVRALARELQFSSKDLYICAIAFFPAVLRLCAVLVARAIQSGLLCVRRRVEFRP